jgi:polyisoprenoid-binding protein YceI
MADSPTPDILFESTKAAKKEGHVWTIEGQLRCTGAKPVTVDVRMRSPSRRCRRPTGAKTPPGVHTTIKVKLSDYGVKIPDRLGRK